MRLRRSLLYLPASNGRAIEKARSLDCDVVIFDLEDAVAPDAKAGARSNAVAAVNEGGFGPREVLVRVNASDTQWGHDDLKALAACEPDGIVLPKVNEARGIAEAASLSGRKPVWAMVETAKSMFAVAEIAAAPGLAGLILGTNDLAKEMRARPSLDRLPFLALLAQVVAAARMNDIAAIDGVFNAIDDLEGFRRQCAQAVEFGFDGKTLVHPAQIEACNIAFSPTDDELAWARAITAAFERPENRALGAIRIDGRMVERLHMEEARRLLSLFGDRAGQAA